MTKATLRIQFHSFWLAGTGAARGRDVDVVCHRDADGFPAMAMSQVKGQLRETAERLASIGAAGWLQDIVEQLFGYRSSAAAGAIDHRHQAGALAFRGEAKLEAAARAAMGPDERAKLFRRLAATKINPLGVAEDKTLRAIEAVVPLELVGIIEIEGEAPANWVELIEAACAATLAFGKLKADGYGRAIASLEGPR
ncbi:MAG: hypothetical protein ABR878_07760 [Roseiarcus sp.]|jgi:hypothetical protein